VDLFPLPAELLAFANKFGFSAKGVVDDLKRTQEVWAQLADLGRQFTSSAPNPVLLG